MCGRRRFKLAFIVPQELAIVKALFGMAVGRVGGCMKLALRSFGYP